MEGIKQAVDDLHTKFEDFKKVQKEIVEKSVHGIVDPLLEQQLHKLNDAISKSEEAVAAAEEAQKLAKRQQSVEGIASEMSAKHAAVSKTMVKYMRGGDNVLTEGEKHELIAFTKELSTFDGPSGGYAVVPEVERRIVEKIYEASPIRQYADVVTIGSDRLEIPYEGDEFEAGWVGELDERPETDTGTFQKIGIDVHEMYAMPAITQKLLDDAYFDIEAYVIRKLSEKFARMENAAFISGDGVNKPRGILTYTSGTSFDQLEQVNSGSAGAVTYAGLVNLVFSLKSSLMSNAVFIMKRSSIKDFRLLLDTNNNPIWAPGFGSTPSTILGFPIVSVDDMPAAASASLSIIFGNLKEGYRIVDRFGTRVLRDPYTRKGFVRIYATKRVGGGVTNFDAIKILKLSA